MECFLSSHTVPWMIRWSVAHSIICVSASFYSLFTQSPLPLCLAGFLTFGVLVFNAFLRPDTESLINAANSVTAVRLSGVLILAGFGMKIPYSWIIGLSILFILLDCLDGWLARKNGEETAFGAFFDKETDAYFMLVLCLLLVLGGRTETWILSIGFFRYGFVVLVYFFGTNIQQEKKTRRARHVFTAVMIILLALFLPIQTIEKPLAVTALLLLFISFGSDTRAVFKRKYRPGPPVPFPVDNPADARDFFDRIAADLTDPHGNPERRLKHRLRLIKESLSHHDYGEILEIGCGSGGHLLALMGKSRRGTGIDISSRMLDEAKKKAQASPFASRIVYKKDDARYLHTVTDSSMDVVLCVGAFEHMLDKQAVLRNVYRVLKAGGRFVCLTPNGKHIWYSRIAPRLKVNTKHLSTDEFITPEWVRRRLPEPGFVIEQIRCWTFVPRGDLSVFMGIALHLLDILGKAFKISSFRGGLLIAAEKPRH